MWKKSRFIILSLIILFSVVSCFPLYFLLWFSFNVFFIFFLFWHFLCLPFHSVLCFVFVCERRLMIVFLINIFSVISCFRIHFPISFFSYQHFPLYFESILFSSSPSCVFCVNVTKRWEIYEANFFLHYSFSHIFGFFSLFSDISLLFFFSPLCYVVGVDMWEKLDDVYFLWLIYFPILFLSHSSPSPPPKS